MQVDPIKPTLKPPGTHLLKSKCGILVSTSAFEVNLRRYIKAATAVISSTYQSVAPIVLKEQFKVERCRLTRPHQTHIESTWIYTLSA